MNKSLLTVEERDVYNLLSEAWNQFIKLEKLHEVDSQEFASFINGAKNIVMSRPVSRQLRQGYQNEPGRGGYTEIKENE